MARAAAEQAALVRQTAEYIASDPYPIVVHRPRRVSDGAGGWRDEGHDPLPPQPVKIQAIGRRSQTERTTPSGTVFFATHEVIGMPDLDIQVNDRFQWRGDDWVVVFYPESPTYRTGVEVMRGGYPHSGGYADPWNGEAEQSG